jgi:DNA polymerase
VTELVLDFETASAVDLKKCGVSVYARHPSTKIICLSYAFDDDPVRTWYPGTPFPEDVWLHVFQKGEVVAHNSTFERYIWNHVLRPIGGHPLAPVSLYASQLTKDTMIRAAYWGLPMGLGDIAVALNLPFGKDLAGRRLMLKATKPKEELPDGTLVWWDQVDPEIIPRVGAYCETDVELERLIDKMIPDLPPEEKRRFVLDQDMNDRGLPLDMNRVQLLTTEAAHETKNLDTEMSLLTNGEVPSCKAVGALKDWLLNMGIVAPGLAKGDVEELLRNTSIPSIARDALELRQEAAKTSVAKLSAMKNSVDAHDNRVRNVFQFYGAGRTGRYAGRLIQPQNFPRPHLKRDELERVLEEADQNHEPIPLKLIASALRSCITAPRYKVLVVVDFSQIEARVLAWLAGQQDILDVFARGEDVYTYAANKIGSKDRTLGKVATLGLGYGMGPDRFVETALTYGLTLTKEFAQETVYAWRDANYMIRGFWTSIEAAVKLAMRFPGKWLNATSAASLKVGRFHHKPSGQDMLLIKLPSGRDLVYREAEWDATNGFSYMGVDQYTKKWTRIRSYGAKIVENIVQAVARDLMLHVMEATDALKLNADIIGTVHDEGIWETDAWNGQTILKQIEGIIRSHGPGWAKGLPMNGEGFVSYRYGK